MAMGSTKWNVEPGPSAFLAAEIRPPGDSNIDRQIERPIPMPARFVAKKVLKIRSTFAGSNADAGVTNRYQYEARFVALRSDHELASPIEDIFHCFYSLH
jgi:hypothetical protein